VISWFRAFAFEFNLHRYSMSVLLNSGSVVGLRTVKQLTNPLTVSLSKLTLN
jgi:hypothetical protein